MRDEDKTREQLIQELQELRNKHEKNHVDQNSFCPIINDNIKKDLEESEEKYRQVVSSISSIIWKADMNKGEMTNIYISPVADTILGLENGTINNKWETFLSYINPEDAAIMQKRIKKGIIRNLSNTDFEFRVTKPDGTKLWFYCTCTIRKNNDKIQIFGNSIDISERKKVEAELENKSNELSQVVNSCPVPMFVINKDHEIIYWNKACEKATNISAERIIETKEPWLAFYPKKRKLMADLIVDNDIESIKQLYNNKSLENSFIEEGYEAEDFFPLLNKWLHFTAAPLKDIEGNIIGAIETLQDKTIEKQAKDALVSAKMLAENASRTKSEFLSNVSHELRTPLSLILGYSDLLIEESESMNVQHAKFAGIIKSGGSRLLEMINALIYIADIEDGKMELEISDFSLPDMVYDIQKVTRSIAIKKNIKLEFTLNPDVRTIYADKSKLKIIFHHLITNAIKFTPEQGKIWVDIRHDHGNTLYIDVKDNGIGISEDDKAKLFDTFVQLDGSPTRRYAGSGLGLALVKKLVEIHKGSIWLESEPKKGSTFHIIIPAQNEIIRHANELLHPAVI
ncbi:PAS domain-containing sensor histidine kinase [Methanolobus bombayensis]|uniref:PAS domain-containing sensor histidine kinase n=1 Tax=Methanolobus bombayensis TaxID=38023 RepID=UPI001AE8BB52|nr:PAS domain-containing sensor histidine kinase [Methanolobus bombayensis]MBP1908684.1 PAS domain S-box-containing protein [Methanolobus bombayensis]